MHFLTLLAGPDWLVKKLRVCKRNRQILFFIFLLFNRSICPPLSCAFCRKPICLFEFRLLFCPRFCSFYVCQGMLWLDLENNMAAASDERCRLELFLEDGLF